MPQPPGAKGGPSRAPALGFVPAPKPDPVRCRPPGLRQLWHTPVTCSTSVPSRTGTPPCRIPRRNNPLEASGCGMCAGAAARSASQRTSRLTLEYKQRLAPEGWVKWALPAALGPPPKSTQHIFMWITSTTSTSFQRSFGQLRVGDRCFFMARFYLAFRQNSHRES